jgi:hypothetical protein
VKYAMIPATMILAMSWKNLKRWNGTRGYELGAVLAPRSNGLNMLR